VQQVEALVVGEEGVGAVLEQQVHNVIVAALGRPQDRRGDGIAALCVDVCAAGDEEVAEGVVVVDGGPLGRVSQSGRGRDSRDGYAHAAA
jgi:hypothetical protein